MDAGETPDMLPGDVADTSQMRQFAPDQSVPWWQGIATYGITRAIDNRFGPVQTQGNTTPGSGAGNSGRTYQIAPNNAGGRPVAPSGASPDTQALGMSPLMLLALAAVAYYALK